jgi:hypothetical protein
MERREGYSQLRSMIKNLLFKFIIQIYYSNLMESSGGREGGEIQS